MGTETAQVEVVDAEIIPAGELSEQEKAEVKPLSLLDLCVKEDAKVWSEKNYDKKEFNTYVLIRYDKLLNVMAAYRKEQLVSDIVHHAVQNGEIEVIHLSPNMKKTKKLVEIADDEDDLDNPQLSVMQLAMIVGGYEKPPNPEHQALMGIDDGEVAEVLQNPKAETATAGTELPLGPSGSSYDGGSPLILAGTSKLDRTDWGQEEDDVYDGLCGYPIG